MRFGLVGLGRMGANVARNAIDHGHEVVGVDPHVAESMAAEGLIPAESLDGLVGELAAPRVVFVWVPHGPATDAVVDRLGGLLQPGDVLMDGGNSHWDDSRRRHDALAHRGVHFLDVGTSGGIEGARNGACFMAGGDREAFDIVEPLLRDLAVDPAGVLFAGPAGSGHFVKLVHNAIEFGMIQAVAEGVEMLERAEWDLDLPKLMELWNHGSVIRSWLVELMGKALAEHPDRADLSTYVEDTDEVKWVLEWAMRQDIPTPVTTDAQQALMTYRDLDLPQAKAVALLRHGFGGHPVHERGDDPRRA